MDSQQLEFYCGEAAVERLLAFCQANGLRRFTLVCDHNTYTALGQLVEARILEQSLEIQTILLEGEQIGADERSVAEVFFKVDARPSTYLAVGSGTITDIARFCSHRTRNPFISMPTAPSVDGYASIIAALVMKGFKVNAWAQAPLAIFADLPTLCRAPQQMIAAGFGDLLGKYTALADWQLDHLLWGEPYRPEIAARMEQALLACVSQLEGLSQVESEAVKRLMEGLVESGLCMLENGNSRPASGSEHHLSHYWEMKLLRLGRPAVLHGTKVGIATVLVAGRYERVRQIRKSEVERLLEKGRLPDRLVEIAEIERAYGPVASGILAEQRRFLDLTPVDYEGLKGKILSNWKRIQTIAAGVPTTAELEGQLERLHAPTQVAFIGMDPADEAEALRYAHYLRDQFTVTKLGRVLNLW